MPSPKRRAATSKKANRGAARSAPPELRDDGCVLHASDGAPRTAYVAGDDFERIPVTYVVRDDLALYQGDIVLGTAAEVAHDAQVVGNYLSLLSAGKAIGVAPRGTVIAGRRFRWPGARVPYEIPPSFPNAERITRAIAHWEAVTPVRFPRRSNEPNWVRFVSASGCGSAVGMRRGMQDIHLARGCGVPQVIHEIGHAFGLYHEQARRDRDRYVDIHLENVEAKHHHNFAISSFGIDVGPYDFASRMHYDEMEFSANGRKTITTKPPGIPIGDARVLSPRDIESVRFLAAGGGASLPSLGDFQRHLKDETKPGVNLLNFMMKGPHQVWVRAVGGDASYWQRCLVFSRPGAPPPDGQPGGVADLVLGGNAPPAAGDWMPLEAQRNDHTYYFGGQNSPGGSWRWDVGLRLRWDQYARGFLLTITFEDLGGAQPDYNDYIVEAAVVQPRGSLTDQPAVRAASVGGGEGFTLERMSEE